MNGITLSRTVAALTGIILSTALFLTTASARIVTVPGNFQTIQGAIDGANVNDTVLVAPGRYAENINFFGKTVTLGSRFLTTGNEQFIEETIIDGGWNGRSAIRIATGENSRVTGFTIENDSSDFGGGIYVRTGSPTLDHLIIQNCKVSRNGGALYATGGATPYIHDVVLRNNNAFSIGGAMSVFAGAIARIDRALIYDNYAGHVGGALHGNGGSYVLKQNTIVHNAALHSAGAIYLTAGGSATITDCILWENEPEEVWILAGMAGTIFSPWFSDIDGGLERVYAGADSCIVWGVGNIDADPLFTAIEDNDYTLTAESPCIDAGNYETVDDPDGTRRDIGVYSFEQEEGGQQVFRVPNFINSIQDAIDEAEDGDVVFVLPGTFEENINFSGKAIIVASKSLSTGNPIYADSTIIDAGGEGSVVTFADEEGEESVLDGFTLTGGSGSNIEGHGEVLFGGGIVCSGSSPAIRNCLIIDNGLNRMNMSGGGVCCSDGSNASFENVRIIGNRANNGAGIFIGNSSPSFKDITISDNATIDEGDGAGGGVLIWESTPRFNNVILANNSSIFGGAISIVGSDAWFTKTLITGNQGSSGTALSLLPGEGSSLVFFDGLTCSGNNSGDGEGSLFYSGGGNTMQFTNSIIFDNQLAKFDLDNGDDVMDTIRIKFTLFEGGQDSVEIHDQNAFIQYAQSNFDDDPLFVDAENGDYHLAEGSPCIDRGDPESEPDPDGTRADVGALYFPQVIQREAAILQVPGDYATIQSAIEAAQSLDTILVAPGRYFENINLRGKDIVVRSRFYDSRNPRDILSTVIDGGGIDACVQFERQEMARTQLIGFTLTNGYSREGGGIYCFRSSPTISYCVITGNSARDGGAGIYLYAANPFLDNITVAGNDADAGGDGLHMRNSCWPELNSTIFYFNDQEEIYLSPDRDPCNPRINYSTIMGGQDGIAVNDNGEVRWQEGNIAADPLFVNAERGDYRLLEESPCLDSGDPESPLDADNSQADMGALAYDPAVNREVDFAIEMGNGWNMIGSPVEPNVPQMIHIWRGLAGDGTMIFAKDQDGHFYWPERQFNNMGDWDARFGYLVKLSRPADLVLTGAPLPVNAPIPLREGWSIVSYLPEEPMTVFEAFGALEEDIRIVKDGYGNFYLPTYNFSNMPPLVQGRGYHVAALREVNLVWGVGERQAVSDRPFSPPSAPEHFEVVQPGPFNMSILMKLPACMSEICAMTSAGMIVGSVGISETAHSEGETFDVGFAVIGDDPTTVEIDGAVEGEALTFVGWDGEERIIPIAWSEGSDRYETDGFAYGSAVPSALPVSFGLAEPYPNPFNSSLRIGFDLPEDGAVEIKIYDLSGRLAGTLVSGEMKAGRHARVMQGGELASGIYLIRMEAGDFRATKKVMLLK